MSDRSYEQMYLEAGQRAMDIRNNGEEPGECHFLVSERERIILLDRPPFFRPERDLSDLEAIRFCGMRITVDRERSKA